MPDYGDATVRNRFALGPNRPKSNASGKFC